MFDRLIQLNAKLVRWNSRSFAKWERTRSRGKSRYVWFTGVLGWGVPMLIAMTLFTYVQQYGANWPTAEEIPILLISLNLILWPLGGYLSGVAMWSTLEVAYRAHADGSTRGSR